MTYKKSYRGFVLWLICFIAVYFGCVFLPVVDEHLLIAIMDNVLTIAMFVLCLLIYLTEKVYWYNGTTYEQALEAGSERRRAFALAHVKRFGLLALIALIYSIISLLVGIPYGVDIAVTVIGMIAAALSTINIKL